MDKLKPKDIKPTRDQYLKEQNGLCAICFEVIAPGEEVLDHCHKTGQLRSVLHRGCNAYIGHLENNMARNKITPMRLAQILANFSKYVQTQKSVLHPTHKTEEEKRERAKKRRKRKMGTAKQPKAKTVSKKSNNSKA